MFQILLILTILLHVAWVLAVLWGLVLGLTGKFRRHPRWQLLYTLLVSGTLISWLLLQGDCLFTRWEHSLRLRVAPDTVADGGFLYHYLGGGLERVGISFGQDLFNLIIVGVLLVGLAGQLIWMAVDWWRKRRMNLVLAAIFVLTCISLAGFSLVAAQEYQAYLYPPLTTEQTLVRQGVVTSVTDTQLVILGSGAVNTVIRLGSITVVRATDGNGNYVTVSTNVLTPNLIVTVAVDRDQPDRPARTIDIFAADLTTYSNQ